MSKTIDQKVVEMQFDNRNFERNVSTTMSSVDKLKQSLNFTGATKGLENVSSATKKIDMTGLSNAVETVRARFSTLEVMGVTALANITNSAVNAGKRMLSALTIDPIKTGFQEYETQINAVQTILANTQSKGSTLTDVNKALDELNTYADQTIYNFTEMTKNIGTFTAAGVDLDKSVSAIKGIANLAAVSGSTSQQASTAMYQLSQALAAGKVSLMDWNSVVYAGMGGEVFQTALIRTARQMGTGVDEALEKYGNFRESLTKGQWLTAEVLTETLTQISGAYTEADLIAQGYTQEQAKAITELAETAVGAATDVKTFTQLWDTLKEAAQSGWTQTWEILVGDFEEAKGLLGELYQTFGDIIGQSAEARNTLLYDAMTSNWKKITDGIADAGLSADVFKDKVTEIAKSQGVDVEALVTEYGSLEAAFKNGAISSTVLNDALLKMTGTSSEIRKKVSDLGLALDGTDATYKKLVDSGMTYAEAQELVNQSTMGQMASLSELSDEQLLSIGYTAEQIQSIRDLSNKYELANGSLKTFMDNVAVSQGRELLVDTLRVSLRSLISVFETVGKAWRDVFPPTTSDQLLNTIKSVRDFALSLRPSEETLKKLQSTFKGLFSILAIGKQALSAVLSPIGTLVGNFAGLSGGILDATASFGEWLYALNKSIEASGSFSVIGDAVSDVVNKIFDGIRAITDGVGGFGGIFSGFGNAVSKVFNFVKDTVGDVLNWIRWNVSAGDIFAGLAGGGIFVLAKKLSGFIDKIKEAFKGLFSGFGGKDGGGFSEVLGSLHDSLESFQQGIQVASIVGIAVAVALLSSSLKKISEIEPMKIAYSLLTIRLMIASLTSGFKSMSKTISKFNAKGTIKASIAMVIMAEAVNILGDAMIKISELNLEQIAKGLLGVGGAMAELVAAMKFLDGVKINLRTSIAMIAIAQACKMLSEAVSAFSVLSWDEIAHGLTAMGGALAEVTAAVSVLSKMGGGGALLGSAGIFITVQSLGELAVALKSFSEMAWDEIGRGLTAMGGALAEVGTVTGLLGKLAGFSGVLGAGSLLIAVQSLSDLADALLKFGSMAWDEIGRGLTAMGGALTELGVVTGLLGKLTGFSGLIGAGTILLGVQGLGKLADALRRFGSMSWEQIGRGLTAMGGALTELAVISGLLGKLAGLSGLIGAGTILLAVQGLGDLADALAKFGSMSWEEIGRGLAGMGGALTELAVISGLTGVLTGIAGLVGAGTITLASQGLDQLANAFQKFGSMSWDEIKRGLAAMGAAMGETALGGLLNTFSGFGAGAIAAMAKPLGDLADSIKKWEGVTVPEGLGGQLHLLAKGVQAFNFSGWGADAIAAISAPLGTMADSISKWSGVSIPDTLGDQLTSLSLGVSAFNFSGWGADAIAAVAPALGSLADSMKKWETVVIPEGLGTDLQSLADGVDAFSFAFVGAWSISSLIDPLKDLAGAVRVWNTVTIPEGIDSDLTALADGVDAFNFSFVGGWSISGVVDPLKKLAEAMKNWTGISLTGVGSDLTSLASGLMVLSDVSIKELASDFEGSSEKIANAVSDMLTSISSNVTNETPKILQSFTALVGTIITSLNSQTENFKMVAKTFGDSLANGFKEKEQTIRSAINLTMANTISSIRGRYDDFRSAGRYMVDGMISGMNDRRSNANSAARSLASSVVTSMKKELDIHSPSGVMRDEVGHWIVEGLAEGITEDMTAEEAASKKAQNITDAFQSELSLLDLAEQTAELEAELAGTNVDYLAQQERQVRRVELAYGEYQVMLENFGETATETQEAYNKYLQEEIDLRTIATNQAEEAAQKTQETYSAQIEFIDKLREEQKASLLDELAAYKNLQRQYEIGSQERIELDEKILSLQEEIADATDEYYNSLTEIQEEANAERLQIDQDYEDQRTQIKEEANEKRLELDQEYADKTKEINDQLEADIESLEKAYEDAVNSRADTLYGSYGLFDEVTKDEEAVTGDQLMENLQGQLDAFADWTKNLNSLIDRGLDEALIEELREMGPSSAAEIAALNAMTDEQLNQYVELWRQKHELAKNQAVYELQGMREETDSEIEQLRKDAEIELEEYRATWRDQVDALDEETSNKLRDLRRNWLDQIDELDAGTQEKLKELKDDWMKSIVGLQTDTQGQFAKMTTHLINTVGDKSQWSAVGVNAIEGILYGIADRTPDLVEGVEDAMYSALRAANRVLEIRSPSRKFKEVGRYSILGMVNGLRDYAYLASDEAETAGLSMLNTLRNTIAGISDAINDNIDTQPTIRPVLDLTDLADGTKQLNTLFSRNQAVSISAGLQRRSTVTDDSDDISSNKAGNVYQFTQNNYSPKALSRVEIYRQTKNQFSAMQRTVET